MGDMEIEQRIEEERAKINALDSQLDSKRTPYLKNQLRFAGYSLDDALIALKQARKANNSHDETNWLSWAELNIQHALEWRSKVKATVDSYGGPDKIMEVPV